MKQSVKTSEKPKKLWMPKMKVVKGCERCTSKVCFLSTWNFHWLILGNSMRPPLKKNLDWTLSPSPLSTTKGGLGWTPGGVCCLGHLEDFWGEDQGGCIITCCFLSTPGTASGRPCSCPHLVNNQASRVTIRIRFAVPSLQNLSFFLVPARSLRHVTSINKCMCT